MPTTETVTLPDGVSLPVFVRGDVRASTPLLILHGYSDSHLSLAPLIAALPASLPVIAPTQRGHGAADKPHGGYAIADLAADAFAILDALGAPRATAVGHSMGAAVATLMAASRPARVDRLVLIGAFADMASNPDVRGLHEGVCGLSDPVDATFVRAFQAGTLSTPVADAFFEMVVAESLKLPARVWAALCAGFLEVDLPGAMRAVQAPTLVVWGDEDGFCKRSDQDAILAAIPGATLRVHGGANHAVHWERPAAVAADIAAFLDEAAGMAAGGRGADRTATRALPVAAASFRT